MAQLPKKMTLSLDKRLGRLRVTVTGLESGRGTGTTETSPLESAAVVVAGAASSYLKEERPAIQLYIPNNDSH